MSEIGGNWRKLKRAIFAIFINFRQFLQFPSIFANFFGGLIGHYLFNRNFWRARSRLYQNENLQENMRLTAFFKIYQILKLKFLKFDKILQILRHLHFFAEISRKLLIFQTDLFAKFLRLQRCKRMQIL